MRLSRPRQGGGPYTPLFRKLPDWSTSLSSSSVDSSTSSLDRLLRTGQLQYILRLSRILLDPSALPLLLFSVSLWPSPGPRKYFQTMTRPVERMPMAARLPPITAATRDEPQPSPGSVVTSVKVAENNGQSK